MPSLEHELAIALAAVREAGRLCQAVQAGLDPGALTKGDRSPVTIADFGSQALICGSLAEAFPEDPVIAEEDAAALRRPDAAPTRDRVVAEVARLRPALDPETVLGWIDHGNASAASPRFWALDPIDGTKGFLRGDQYAVALALILDGRFALGVLGCPNLDPGALADGKIRSAAAAGGSLVYGIPGQGAWLLPLADPTARPSALRVSRQSDIRLARCCESVEAAHTAHGTSAKVSAALGIRVPATRVDSQAKYAAVAAGAAEAYLRLPSKPGYVEKIWDHAAGTAVVCAAGGQVTDIAGRPLDLGHGRLLASNRGVVVTNGRLHATMLGAIDQVLGAE
ncbi:MAG: 3'(2'),5'-bisphosphate nucleotidase [Chloroflexi bacterium]|nr:3'(2'),5'-bisphosphate nucleotidase [Chloroflexota bacterium]